MWTLGTDFAAPLDAAWAELVELDAWPHWGPTVREAVLDDGARTLTAGATGRVRTVAGPWLPFTVTEWDVDDVRRTWAWRVAGVPATTHTVTATGPGTCRVEMGVPTWAPAYLTVIALALPKVRRGAEGRT